LKLVPVLEAVRGVQSDIDRAQRRHGGSRDLFLIFLCINGSAISLQYPHFFYDLQCIKCAVDAEERLLVVGKMPDCGFGVSEITV
jgi:hypothetical protein